MQLIDDDLVLQFFTVLEGDHLGVKGVEILFFTLFVGKTFCKTPRTRLDGGASSYRGRLVNLKRKINKLTSIK